MKKLLFIASIVALSVTSKAQEAPKADVPKLYNPAADAKAEIAAAVKKAGAEHKNVLLQIGGNWCSWCLLFNKLVTTDAELNKYMNANFEVLHVNWSPENKMKNYWPNLVTRSVLVFRCL
jgi:thioredoxin-related protein